MRRLIGLLAALALACPAPAQFLRPRASGFSTALAAPPASGGTTYEFDDDARGVGSTAQNASDRGWNIAWNPGDVFAQNGYEHVYNNSGVQLTKDLGSGKHRQLLIHYPPAADAAQNYGQNKFYVFAPTSGKSLSVDIRWADSNSTTSPANVHLEVDGNSVGSMGTLPDAGAHVIEFEWIPQAGDATKADIVMKVDGAAFFSYNNFNNDYITTSPIGYGNVNVYANKPVFARFAARVDP